MAAPGRKESKSETERIEREKNGIQAIAIDLPIQAIEVLKHLQRVGIYGATIEEVAERIICRHIEGMISIVRK